MVKLVNRRYLLAVLIESRMDGRTKVTDSLVFGAATGHGGGRGIVRVLRFHLTPFIENGSYLEEFTPREGLGGRSLSVPFVRVMYVRST